MKTFVIGHKNPDTDSVVSAIILSRVEGHIPAVTAEVNKETAFVLKRFGFDSPVIIPKDSKQVILVDHNSPEEMHENIKKEEISGIVDHHKLSGPFTDEPVSVYIKPCGSTATIVSIISDDHSYGLDRDEASLLIAGIISDTLNFTSPTATDLDRETLEKLNQIAGLSIEELAQEMFAAKSDISDIKSADLIEKDYKVFDMSGKKIGIGVWETTLPQTILDRQPEIDKILNEKKVKENLDYILFGAVDILKSETHFLLGEEAEAELVSEVFGAKAKKGIATLGGVVSRKKQIVPKLEKYFGGN